MMQLNKVDPGGRHPGGKTIISPLLMGSRVPPCSMQPWEMTDVDFLLPSASPPMPRQLYVDSVERLYPTANGPEFSYNSEFDESTRPLVFRSGGCWQDMSLNEPVMNEFAPYFVGDIFDDKLLPLDRSKSMPSARIRVNCSDIKVSTHSHGHGDANADLQEAFSVLSPTMLDKKILVSDSDLKLFSANSSSIDNMRALAHESPSHRPHRFMFPSKPEEFHRAAEVEKRALPPVTPRHHQKRRVATRPENEGPDIKRAKVSDQPVGRTPSYNDPYWRRSEGFYGMLPRAPGSSKQAVPPVHGTLSIARPLLRAGTQLRQNSPHPQSPSAGRRIGIYSPEERRKRLQRFHEKRKFRVYHKRIKYDCRKRLANSCPRIKGRFVRKTEFLEAKMKQESDAASTLSSEG